MGAMEEAGKTAAGVIDALKASPALLVMAIINILLVGLMFYIAHSAVKGRDREVSAIYQAQREVQQLLAQCYRPQGLIWDGRFPTRCSGRFHDAGWPCG